MIQYLVILLDDTSVSYCHCDNPYKERRLIGLDDLKAGILHAMKENLMIQFVYPNYELPKDYIDIINTIDHHDITPWPMKGDIVVLPSLPFEHSVLERIADMACVLRVKKTELFSYSETIMAFLSQVQRINIVITDIEAFTEDDLQQYNKLLGRFSAVLRKEYLAGHTPQVNLLTDRMVLDRPNHCNAGVENMVLAPNGKYYICPAFYYCDPEESIDYQNIKNQQLLQLDHAPLCRHCDAYHCRRCVWLNRKTTHEVNTPSREQCIVSHTERNAARCLLESIRKEAIFMPEINIKEIDYLDPFEVRKKW